MGTWTGTNANCKRTDFLGSCVQKTYSIPAVNTNTGGTLTCGGVKIIDNVVVSVSKAAGGGVASIVSSFVGKVVTVVHTDPAANATVRITVWGRR
jgi:hypothetical protein